MLLFKYDPVGTCTNWIINVGDESETCKIVQEFENFNGI